MNNRGEADRFPQGGRGGIRELWKEPGLRSVALVSRAAPVKGGATEERRTEVGPSSQLAGSRHLPALWTSKLLVLPSLPPSPPPFLPLSLPFLLPLSLFLILKYFKNQFGQSHSYLSSFMCVLWAGRM